MEELFCEELKRIRKLLETEGQKLFKNLLFLKNLLNYSFKKRKHNLEKWVEQVVQIANAGNYAILEPILLGLQFLLAV